MGHLAAERGLSLRWKAGEHRCGEQARRDGHYSDLLVREIAGKRQGHADDAPLGRGVGCLTDLALKRGNRRGAYDHAALTRGRLIADHSLDREPDDVEGADQVDRDRAGERLQRHHAGLAEDPGRRSDPGAVHHDAQFAQAVGDIEGSGDLLGVGDVGGCECCLAEIGGGLLAT